MTKKLLSVALCLILFVGIFSITAYATTIISSFNVTMTRIAKGVKVSQLNVTADADAGFTVDSVTVYDVTNSKELTSNSTFQEGNKYRLSVVLVVKDDYEFATDGNVPASTLVGTMNWDVNFDTVSKAEGYQAWYSIEASYTVENCPKGYIDNVAMNIKPPVAGERASFAATSENPTQYSSLLMAPNLSEPYRYMTDGVEWKDITAGKHLNEGDVFQVGHTYSLILLVQANNNYAFVGADNNADNVHGKINGVRCDQSEVRKNDDIVRLRSVFTVYGTIRDLDVTVGLPVVGCTPYRSAIPQNSHTTINDQVQWEYVVDGAYYYMRPDGVNIFEANNDYLVSIHVVSTDMYRFAVDEQHNAIGNITILGEPVDSAWVSDYKDYDVLFIKKWYHLGSNDHIHKYILYSNADYHWNACECGQMVDYEEHVYDNDFDTDCNVCGHIRQVEQTGSFTVTFHANGGTGSMAKVTGVSGAYYLPACGFTAPAGKHFVAWAINSPSGSQSLPGLKITVGSNITVYPVWEEKTHTHSFAMTVYEPTCTECGYDEYICQYCSYTYRDNLTPAIGHDYYIDEQLSPTCTYDGYTKYVCSHCGNFYYDNCKAKLGHAYNANGICSRCSDWKYKTSAPKLVSVTNAKGGITVTWNALTGAEGYMVYRKTGSSGWSLIASGMSNTSYTDTKAAAGTQYTYTVKAYYGGTNSKYNTTGLTTVRLTNPAVKVANATAGVNVTWGKVAGAKGYYVYRKTGTGSYAKIATTTALSYVDKTAKSGTAYTYAVRAYNGSVLSSFTGVNILRLANTTAKVANATAGVSVTWTKVAGAKGYYVYRKTGSGSYSKIATTTALSYVDKTAKAGTAYTYAVRAYNGSTQDAFTAVSIVRLTTPSVKVANTASGPKATWGKVTGAKGYYVYRKTANGSYAKIATTTSLSYVDKTAKSGTKYTYAVRAYSGTSTSAYTNNAITCKK